MRSHGPKKISWFVMTYSASSWFIIILAALATGGWRLTGLLLADLITPESWLMQWVNGCTCNGSCCSVLDHGLPDGRFGYNNDGNSATLSGFGSGMYADNGPSLVVSSS